MFNYDDWKLSSPPDNDLLLEQLYERCLDMDTKELVEELDRRIDLDEYLRDRLVQLLFEESER